jgi:hypothetical protein
LRITGSRRAWWPGGAPSLSDGQLQAQLDRISARAEVEEELARLRERLAQGHAASPSTCSSLRTPPPGPPSAGQRPLPLLVTYGPARLSDGRIAGIVIVTRLCQIVRRETLRAQPAR